jgi:proteasome lid subunit RPN8/RPN11
MQHGSPAGASDSAYLVWQAEGGSLTIEFSSLVLEQIRQACFAATNGVLRGGRGVGGLLFGTRLGSLWRVLGWRLIECSYPRGEAFHLSGADEIRLESLLGEEPPLEMNLLGWFASHPRGGLLLSQEERRIHGVFFSASERLMITMRANRSGQLAMVIHSPSPGQSATLRAHTPELLVSPMTAEEIGATSRETNSRTEAPDYDASPPGAPAAHTTYLAIGFSAVLVITAAIAVLGWQLTQTGLIPNPEAMAAKMSPPTRLLSLHAGHSGEQLEVNWDPRAYEQADLAFAAVTYESVATERSLELDAAALTGGRVSIPLKNAPLSVTLTLRTSKGRALKETVRFTGQKK